MRYSLINGIYLIILLFWMIAAEPPMYSAIFYRHECAFIHTLHCSVIFCMWYEMFIAILYAVKSYNGQKEWCLFSNDNKNVGEITLNKLSCLYRQYTLRWPMSLTNGMVHILKYFWNWTTSYFFSFLCRWERGKMPSKTNKPFKMFTPKLE